MVINRKEIDHVTVLKCSMFLEQNLTGVMTTIQWDTYQEYRKIKNIIGKKQSLATFMLPRPMKDINAHLSVLKVGVQDLKTDADTVFLSGH